MPRFWPFLFILLFIFSPVFAQEDPDESPLPPPADSEWFDREYYIYSSGDHTFNISLGVIFPTIFTGQDGSLDMGLGLGGVGSLAYDYHLLPNFFVGAEVNVMFASTRGNNNLFIIPIGARIGYQFVYRRIEVPVSLMAGFAPQLYTGENYFGLVMKPRVSFFWRYNPDWSFGFNTAWWFLPQWARDSNREPQNVYGNFLELTLSARYHF